MTFQAYHFTVTRAESGRLAGYALLCPAARYASTLFFGETRILRGFASVETWRKVERSVERGWEHAGLVPRREGVATLLLAGELESLYRLQLFMTVPIEALDGGAAAALDDYLRGQGKT